MTISLGFPALPRDFDPDELFALTNGALGNASAFRAGVASLMDEYAANRSIVNLREDRYRFLVAFAAALSQGSTTLLPASRSPSAVAEVIAAHPGCLVLDDTLVADNDNGPPASSEVAGPVGDFIAAIGHTSGSTGMPTAHAKNWSSLCATTALNAATIRAALSGAAPTKRTWIVATVPPQHMYGLETSVLLPLLAGFSIHGGRPLLPADVAAALAEVPAPRVLVSTPVHLRSLVESGMEFPDVAVVVSATAPLSQSLALRVEQRLHAVLVEMFGSTETCIFATRRTAQDESWHAYPDVQLESMDDGTLVRAPWFEREQLLHDIIEMRPDRSFVVIGRHRDLIEVAGKRASLADLTRRLAALPGVRDAVIFQPSGETGGRARRCAALVVAPGFSAREIARRFRHEVDAAFVPRPLVIVPSLPRNELGKLPLERLLQLLEDARND